MKKVAAVLIFIIIAGHASAQNWNEFFRQKRTQIRYLWQQIAALQVYIELGQKGYGIYRDGLRLIGDIKDGEFNLHKNYFASLDAVNPGVADAAEIEEIIIWHEQIKTFDQIIRKQDVGAEQSSLLKLYSGIVSTSQNNVQQLELLLTVGNYQLKDEERLSQIKKLLAGQQDMYQLARSVYQDVFVLRLQKGNERKDNRVINSFHGLN